MTKCDESQREPTPRERISYGLVVEVPGAQAAAADKGCDCDALVTRFEKLAGNFAAITTSLANAIRLA